MKKYRFLSLFLSLLLILPLTVPAGAGIVDEMEVRAAAALLVEGNTGEVLFEQSAHEKRAPASITKVMTALLTLEAIDRGELSMSDVITVSATAMNGLAADGSTQNIRPGEQISVKDLLYCALIASANESCNILAEAVSGTVSGFVDRMNQRAAELGMENTHYVNPHGLDAADHHTTAYDIWLLAHKAMEHPTFREIVSTEDYYVPATNLSEQRHFYTTNALLSNWRYIGYTYGSAIGIKTGTTAAAGQCLLSAATEGDRTLFCVVLGAENEVLEDGTVRRHVFLESKRLLQWGFENFSMRSILGTSDLQGEVAVTLSKTERVVAVPNGTLRATLPNDVSAEDFTVTPTYHAESVEAPVKKGQVLGQVTVSYQGRDYGTLELVALNDVERDEWMYRVSRVRAFFSQPWLKWVALAVVVLLVVLFVLRILFVRRRRAYHRQRAYNRRRNNYRGR